LEKFGSSSRYFRLADEAEMRDDAFEPLAAGLAQLARALEPGGIQPRVRQ
jgi:hypothetical protein